MNTWIDFGKHFGYPNCCINDFVKRNNIDYNFIPPSRTQKRIGNKSGFIPCSYCAWKVMTKQCKLEDLIRHRKEKISFPYA